MFSLFFSSEASEILGPATFSDKPDIGEGEDVPGKLCWERESKSENLEVEGKTED